MDFDHLKSSVSPENVNALDGDGMTRLYRICLDCSEDDDVIINDIVKWLISIGANVNLGRIERYIISTPLWVALHRGLDKLASTLLECGARADLWDTISGSLPIHAAMSNSGSLHTLLMILESYPYSVFARDVSGLTALHRAANNNNIECCRALLLAGSQVNVSDNFSFMPIHYSRDNDVTRILLDFGSSKPMGAAFWCDPMIIPRIEARERLRVTCLALIQLRRRRALNIRRNGRDLLRIVAQFIWVRRME